MTGGASPPVPPGVPDGVSGTVPDGALLREQILDLEKRLHAIRAGGIDSVVLGGPDRESVFALTNTSRTYRAIAENMGEGAATVSERGVVLYVNLMLVAMLAGDRRHLVGAPVTDMFGAADQSTVSGLLAVAPGATTRAEANLRRRDGALVPVLLAATCLDLEGVLVRCLIATDLTARKEAEDALARGRRELERRSEELERSNRDLEQFAYVTSHDLQEPLRMVSSYTTLLAEDLGDSLDDTARRHLDFAHDGAARMQQLLSDLLHYAQVSRGADTGRQRVDCDQLVETATVDLHEAIAAAGATVTHDPLPTVTGMRTEIQQLFTNVVGNAVKFRGEEPVRVHVSAARDGPMWRFSVADNGIGIDPAQAERIFDVFRRLHKPCSYPGTGIGLAICKKVVEHHGGRIWVESQPGTGATFRFTLPAADNDQVDR